LHIMCHSPLGSYRADGIGRHGTYVSHARSITKLYSTLGVSIRSWAAVIFCSGMTPAKLPSRSRPLVAGRLKAGERTAGGRPMYLQDNPLPCPLTRHHYYSI
jgi:hypothetical protein